MFSIRPKHCGYTTRAIKCNIKHTLTLYVATLHAELMKCGNYVRTIPMEIVIQH